MDSIFDENKKNYPAKDPTQKSSERHKKDGLVYDYEHNNSFSKADLTNGMSELDQAKSPSTQLHNDNLESRLQHSFLFIQDIKKRLSEFEKVTGKNIDGKNTKMSDQDNDAAISGKIVGKKRKHENNSDDSDSGVDKHKKTKLSKEYLEEEIQRLIKDNRKNSKEIAVLRAIVKRHKKKIDHLERQSEVQLSNRRYKSQSISEEENSDESVDRSHRQFGFTFVKGSPNRRNSNSPKRSRGRPRKTPITDRSLTKTEPEGRRGRGRPRKSFLDDKGMSVMKEHREKRSVGRPRKSKIEEQSLNSFVASMGKRSRGRPRKSGIANDNSSVTDNDHKEMENSFNVTRDSDSSKSDEPRRDTHESRGTKEKRSSGRIKSHSDSISKSLQSKDDVDFIEARAERERSKKSITTDHEIFDKRSRMKSRMMAADVDRDATGSGDHSKENLSAVEESPVKSRGRPKKIRSSNETDNVDENL